MNPPLGINRGKERQKKKRERDREKIVKVIPHVLGSGSLRNCSTVERRAQR
jgi:hypothetical protein